MAKLTMEQLIEEQAREDDLRARIRRFYVYAPHDPELERELSELQREINEFIHDD